jgi:hypothetical protein
MAEPNPKNEMIPTMLELVPGYQGQVIDLDEQWAVKDFLGKTAAEAFEMYRKDGGHSYTEDLAYMAVGGLEYYLPPAFFYLQSDDSREPGNSFLAF